MKILLSAYACEPNKGSEPGVGWHWANELTKLGHDVWVLTRANNKLSIAKVFLGKQLPNNLHFLYYDLPFSVRRWKKGNRWIHLYYLLWQWGAYKHAKRIHSDVKFDYVHHVTFVGIRQPSFMGNLGIPFIFGPVAGGESAPWRLRRSYNWWGFILDLIRDILNIFVRFDPFMRKTFKKAFLIYVTSEQTKKLIPKKFQSKTYVKLAIGLDNGIYAPSPVYKRGKEFKVLYIGRFLYWKGMHIGIRAFAELLKNNDNARLTMVGEGPEGKHWRQLVKKMKIDDHVDWIPWVDRKDISNVFSGHDILLFPSLHDSGGMVILEAMVHGLPVVSFDIGGPKEIVDESSGVIIKSNGGNAKSKVELISNALKKLQKNNNFRNKLSIGAKKRVCAYNWSRLVSQILIQLEKNLKINP